jgi:NADPH:quinone reductase-like Zn-dependent oxidoreductase
MRDLLTAPIGAQAEQVALDGGAVASAPRSVSTVKVSTLPLNGLTAAQALDMAACCVRPPDHGCAAGCARIRR